MAARPAAEGYRLFNGSMVSSDKASPAGAPVVVRLTTTGLALTGSFVRVDKNERKRIYAELESERDLSKALDAERQQSDKTPLPEELASTSLPKGQPESRERLRLTEAAQATIELPIELAADLTRFTGKNGDG